MKNRRAEICSAKVCSAGQTSWMRTRKLPSIVSVQQLSSWICWWNCKWFWEYFYVSMKLFTFLALKCIKWRAFTRLDRLGNKESVCTGKSLGKAIIISNFSVILNVFVDWVYLWSIETYIKAALRNQITQQQQVIRLRLMSRYMQTNQLRFAAYTVVGTAQCSSCQHRVSVTNQFDVSEKRCNVRFRFPYPFGVCKRIF